MQISHDNPLSDTVITEIRLGVVGCIYPSVMINFAILVWMFSVEQVIVPFYSCNCS